MGQVIDLYFISALLSVESILALVFYFLKLFKKSKYRIFFNIFTSILYVISILNLGGLAGKDMNYMLLLLLGCGALAIILPNIKIKNNET